MTDLPDDIWETALQTWQKAHVMSLHEDQVRILAEAILAERERCEKAAIDLCSIYKSHLIRVAIREPHKLKAILEAYDPFGNILPSSGQFAIRSPSQPERTTE